MKWTLLFVTFFSFAAFAQEPANSGVVINVGDAKVKKSLMAMPPILYLGTPRPDGLHTRVVTDLFNTVFNDLDVSSYFQFINQAAFLEDITKTSLRPAPEPNGFKFDSWKQIGAEFLIRGGASIVGDTVAFEVYAYHVPQQKLILGQKYQGKINDVRRVAHTFTADLIRAMTGKKGYFLSRIVVSSDRDSVPKRPFKEIYVMDWDGYNLKRITNHQSISISPNWSPDGKSVVYTSYAFHTKAKQTNPDLFMYELFTGKRFLISSRMGMNSGATFTPDGKRIFLTMTFKGNADIYSVNTDGEDIRQFTDGPNKALNVEPDIHPDGNSMVFSSDRSGRAMIFTMNLGTRSVSQKTIAGFYNASPVWSPDGKKIAFAGQKQGNFDIYIMNADGTGMLKLTDARRVDGRMSSNEDPTFSPDGRQIMFVSDRSGKKQIYVVNVDGTNERRITTDNYNYFKPKWSRAID